MLSNASCVPVFQPAEFVPAVRQCHLVARLMGKTHERGYTLVPLKMYLKNGKIKMEIGLAKGKTLYDKREVLKKRSADREIEKVMKGAKR